MYLKWAPNRTQQSRKHANQISAKRVLGGVFPFFSVERLDVDPTLIRESDGGGGRERDGTGGNGC